ncbi:unnamed protein product [Rotaria socialis]|uniref:MULE transposase domain-containing protein n=1 Tax=Rotaria socialis TaxID=392032 RepID=A0A818AJR7_9BILA|nr:unnamed protein product [Rotaria socialis]
MSIVKSSKNKNHLLLDGFRYRSANKSESIWRCYKNSCAGRVRFDGLQYLKCSAVASYYPPRRIINEALTIVSKEDGAAVPSYTSSQRTIERKRRKKYLPLPRPKSFGEIMIPMNSKKPTVVVDFYYMIMKIAPQLFEQLYVIHGYIYGRALPLVYCMAAGTAEVLYNEVFNVILQHLSGRPKTITIGFEKAVENVIGRSLPTTSISGCFFHFKQCLWRKIKSLGLQQSFVDDSQVRRCLKNFDCLAFVPVPFVIVEFEKTQESAPDLINSTNFVLLEIILLHVPMYVLDFVDYFEDTFIGRVIRNNRRRAPRFSVNMWNCFSRLDEELPRTNNSSEGWNRAIKNSARENPSIYESIADLRIEQHSNLILAEQLEAGVVKTRKRIKYEMLNEQLQQLASNFYLLPRDIYFKRARALFNF